MLAADPLAFLEFNDGVTAEAVVAQVVGAGLSKPGALLGVSAPLERVGASEPWPKK